MVTKTEELVKQYQACFLRGDTQGLMEAGEAIFNQYGQRVQNWAASLFYRYRTAEVVEMASTDDEAPITEMSDTINDIWLQVFAQLQKNAETGKEIRSFSRWLYGFTRNVVCKEANVVWDGRRDLPISLDDQNDDGISQEIQVRISAETPDEVVLRKELVGRMKEAREALDERERTYVEQRYDEELSAADIAKAEGLSEDAIRYHLRKAIRKMQEHQEREEGE